MYVFKKRVPNTIMPTNIIRLNISLISGCFWENVGSMLTIISFLSLI